MNKRDLSITKIIIFIFTHIVAFRFYPTVAVHTHTRGDNMSTLILVIVELYLIFKEILLIY